MQGRTDEQARKWEPGGDARCNAGVLEGMLSGFVFLGEGKGYVRRGSDDAARDPQRGQGQRRSDQLDVPAAGIGHALRNVTAPPDMITHHLGI